MTKPKDRIKRIIPDNKNNCKAFLYIWKIWIEELYCWNFYAGRRHENYILEPYLHSSEYERFRHDLATRKTIIYEILEYGDDKTMGLAETRLLTNAENGLGAAKSANWYNQTNGGGHHAKGASSTVRLDNLWETIKPRLDNYEEDPCDVEKYTFNREERRILKKFIKKEKLDELIITKQYLQTRDGNFDPEHVRILREKFDEDAEADSWQPIIILLNAEITWVEDGDKLKQIVKFKNGGMVIISGNHRSRGNISSTQGIGLNALLIPEEMWKGLDEQELKTLSNRCNPDPEEPALPNTYEDIATWIEGEVDAKNLYKKSEDGKTDVPDFTHNLILKELKEEQKLSSQKIKKSISVAQRRFERKELSMKNENLIDFSDKGLALDSQLQLAYKKKVAILTDDNEDGSFDWIYKLSWNFLKMGHVISYIRKNNYKKKGRVWVFFNSKTERSSALYKKLKTTFEKDLKEILSDSYDIEVKELPVTTIEAKEEGFYLNATEAAS